MLPEASSNVHPREPGRQGEGTKEEPVSTSDPTAVSYKRRGEPVPQFTPYRYGPLARTGVGGQGYGVY